MTAQERKEPSIIDTLQDKAVEAEDYNDMNLARLCLTAADRIAELEGALKDLADASEDGYGDNFVDGKQYDTFKDAASSARAVLAKGDG